MADENIKQVMQDAILDADSLEKFINGSDSETVLTRLSAEYPTLKSAIRQMFENGGLSATPFNTYSDMISSDIPDGSFAVVVYDSERDKNGFYKKSNNSFVYLKYNPLLELDKKPDVNYFMHPDFAIKDVAEVRGATVLEDLTYILDLGLQATSRDVAIRAYRYFLGEHLPESIANGKTRLTFSADVFVNTTTNAGELKIELRSLSTSFRTSALTNYTKANEWHTVSVDITIDERTEFFDLAFVKRGDATTLRFKNPKLTISGYTADYYPLKNAITSSNANNTVFVGKSGSDANDGAQDSPVATISKAVEMLSNGGTVIVTDNADYREHVQINTPHHITIKPLADGEVNLFGSDKLALTKTTGYSKVYQAPLAIKPTGMAIYKGQPMIAEWGTPSKPIASDERHHLHRSKTHRLPYTELFEAESVSEVEQNNGTWYWQDGTIYLSATDGSDASKKRYEARARSVLSHSGGSIELIRVNSWFSQNYGMQFEGLSVTRTACKVYGSRHNGFADNANFVRSYKDIAGGCGNDGFNCTVDLNALSKPDSQVKIDAVYFDPYGHDNGDDGFSCHYRSDGTVYGGLFEYNTKADVVHVTGSACVCYNTVAQGTNIGFLTQDAPDSQYDSERKHTVFECYGTVSRKNNTSYRSNRGAELHCYDAKSIDSAVVAYSEVGNAKLIATDCKVLGAKGDVKSGNVTIHTSDNLV